MSESPVTVASSETENPIEIKQIQNPARFRRLVIDVRGDTHYFEDYFRIRVRHEPEKPKGARLGNSYEWNEYDKAIAEREEGLNEVVLSLNPVYKPEQVGGVKKIFSREETARNERARKQAIVDKYNAELFNKLLSVSESCLFGNEQTRSQKLQELTDFVSQHDRPDRKRQYEHFQERSKNESDKKTLVDIANNYHDPQTPCNMLREQLNETVRKYQSAEPDPHGLEVQQRLLDYIKSKRSDLAIPSSRITPADAGKLFYLPQINALARVQDKYFDNPVGLRLEISMLETMPTSDNLIAIPYEKMFPPKAAPENIPPQEIEESSPTPNRTLNGFLDKLLMNKQQLDMDEVIKVPGGISNEVIADLITKDLNPFKLTRRELLDAGYVFVNAVGGGEKYIIKQVIEIDGQEIDLGRLPFLTEKQLQAALDLDKQEMESAGITKSPQEIAKDMVDVLHGSYYFYSVRLSEVEEGLKKQDPKASEGNIRDKAKEQVDKEWEEGKGYHYYKRIEKLTSQLKQSQLNLSEGELKSRAQTLADQELAEGKIAKEDRKVPLPFFFVNRGLERMNGHCPMLNCSHRFWINNDLTFVDDKSPVRLSTVIAHLAHHGLSERGDGLPRSFDQRYMTMTEYYKLMMERM
jgi:hypothetical protein